MSNELEQQAIELVEKFKPYANRLGLKVKGYKSSKLIQKNNAVKCAISHCKLMIEELKLHFTSLSNVAIDEINDNRITHYKSLIKTLESI